MTDDPGNVDLIALLRERRMDLSMRVGNGDLDYNSRDQARELIRRVDLMLSKLLSISEEGVKRRALIE